MAIHELDLVIGDVVEIGEYKLTVMDIENGEVTFRVIEPQSDDDQPVESTTPRPR